MNTDAVMDIERSFWESSGDQDFYQRHVADEGKFILSMGVMDKQEVVSSMASADAWDSYKMQEQSLIPIADDVVGLVYAATGRRKKQAGEYRANILSVYRQKNGNWELLLHQQTPIDQA